MLKIQLYHHKNKLHYKIYFNRKQLLKIVIFSQYYYFDQLNAALGSIRDFFQKQ